MSDEKNIWAKSREAAEHAIRRSKGIDSKSIVDSVAAAIDYVVMDAIAVERKRCVNIVLHGRGDLDALAEQIRSGESF